ncbi:MAG: cell division protein ZapE, partial [Acetobacteraceae bacterium]|nr:cell division protein ZapE [Acetobacteraceae bacterium]
MQIAQARDSELAPLGRGPEASYQARLVSGDLAEDPAQAAAIARLQALWLALRGY